MSRRRKQDSLASSLEHSARNPSLAGRFAMKMRSAARNSPRDCPRPSARPWASRVRGVTISTGPAAAGYADPHLAPRVRFQRLLARSACPPRALRELGKSPFHDQPWHRRALQRALELFLRFLESAEPASARWQATAAPGNTSRTTAPCRGSLHPAAQPPARTSRRPQPCRTATLRDTGFDDSARQRQHVLRRDTGGFEQREIRALERRDRIRFRPGGGNVILRHAPPAWM